MDNNLSECIDIEFFHYYYTVRFFTPNLKRFTSKIFGNYISRGDILVSKFLTNLKDYYYKNDKLIFNQLSSNFLETQVFIFTNSGELSDESNNVFSNNNLYFDVKGNIRNKLQQTVSKFKYLTDYNGNRKVLTYGKFPKTGDLFTPDLIVSLNSTQPIVLGDRFKIRWSYNFNYFILLSNS